VTATERPGEQHGQASGAEAGVEQRQFAQPAQARAVNGGRTPSSLVTLTVDMVSSFVDQSDVEVSKRRTMAARL